MRCVKLRCIGILLFSFVSFFYVVNVCAEDVSPNDIGYDLKWNQMKRDVKRTLCNRCWVIGGGLGFALTDVGTKNVYVNNGNPFPPPANQDLYIANKPDASGILGFSAGYRWYNQKQWFPGFVVGGRFLYLFSHDIKGKLLQQSNPNFYNFNFNLATSSDILTVFGKINLARWKNFSPFVGASLGMSINSVDNYSQAAIPPAAGDSPAYRSKTSVNFAYGVDAGVDYFLNYLWTISAVYQYWHLGNVASGAGTNAWSNASLNFGDLTGNIFYMSISYAFKSIT